MICGAQLVLIFRFVFLFVSSIFRRFVKFVETQSIPSIKYELEALLWPLVCHIYIEMIKGRDSRPAAEFLRKFAYLFGPIENLSAPVENIVNGSPSEDEQLQHDIFVPPTPSATSQITFVRDANYEMNGVLSDNGDANDDNDNGDGEADETVDENVDDQVDGVAEDNVDGIADGNDDANDDENDENNDNEHENENENEHEIEIENDNENGIVDDSGENSVVFSYGDLVDERIDYFRELVSSLSLCLRTDELESIEITRKFRNAKYDMVLSLPALYALKHFMAKQGHVVILHILQTWFSFEIHEALRDSDADETDYDSDADDTIEFYDIDEESDGDAGIGDDADVDGGGGGDGDDGDGNDDDGGGTLSNHIADTNSEHNHIGANTNCTNDEEESGETLATTNSTVVSDNNVDMAEVVGNSCSDNENRDESQRSDSENDDCYDEKDVVDETVDDSDDASSVRTPPAHARIKKLLNRAELEAKIFNRLDSTEILPRGNTNSTLTNEPNEQHEDAHEDAPLNGGLTNGIDNDYGSLHIRNKHLQNLRLAVMKTRRLESPIRVLNVLNADDQLATGVLDSDMCHMACAFNDSTIRLWHLNQSRLRGRRPFASLASRTCDWVLDYCDSATSSSSDDSGTEDNDDSGNLRRSRGLNGICPLFQRQPVAERIYSYPISSKIRRKRDAAKQFQEQRCDNNIL